MVNMECLTVWATLQEPIGALADLDVGAYICNLAFAQGEKR